VAVVGDEVAVCVLDGDHVTPCIVGVGGNAADILINDLYNVTLQVLDEVVNGLGGSVIVEDTVDSAFIVEEFNTFTDLTCVCPAFADELSAGVIVLDISAEIDIVVVLYPLTYA